VESTHRSVPLPGGLGRLLSSSILYIGLIWVAFDPRKQGGHDKIAGTVAIRRSG
jgi:uncharacterized RDD family membrane protein YckC